MGKVISQAALLATVKGLGFKGKTLPDLKKWMDSDDGYETLLVGGEELDVEKSWKTVTIAVRADAGEQVNVEDMSQPETEAMDGEEEEEEPMPKSGRRAAMVAAQRSAVQAAKGRNGLGVNPEFASAFVGTLPQSQGGGLQTDAKSWANVSKRKAYTKAAQAGMKFGGAPCVYADGDRAEFAGAVIRLAGYGNHSDAEIKGLYHQHQFRNDRDIVQKTGLIGNNASYGYLVIGEVLPELIENFNTYGAARQLASVTPMLNDSRTVMKMEGDVTVYDEGEADTLTASDATVGRVTIYAKKTTALCRISNEMLADSAIDVSNMLTRSISRQIGKWEDESFINGDHNRPGLATTTFADSNATYDAALSTGWGDYTTATLQAWKAKLAGWALESENLAIVCNPSFYEAVLKVRAYSAGGTPGDSLLNGTRIRAWDGVPVVFSHIMPRTYSADQDVAYIGDFTNAVKFGVVRGSEQIATSTERYFDTDETALRYVQRWGYVLHDVTAPSAALGSGVVALKD